MNGWMSPNTSLKHPIPYLGALEPFQFFVELLKEQVLRGGGHLLLRLKRTRSFIDTLHLIEKSEIFEPPRILNGHAKGKNLNISPTTARYCNNTINFISLFGLNALGGNIVEIGGGYGGECKIIHDFGVVVGTPPKSYLALDLPTSIGLIRRYLNFFGYDQNVEIASDMNYVRDQIDLVISNGAYSEMDRELQEGYLANFISKAKNGYFITNFHTHSVPIGGFSLREFVDRLRAIGKNVFVLTPTHRWLSAFDEGPSQLVVFGDHLNLSNPPGTYYDLIRYYAIQKFGSVIKKLESAVNRFIFA